MKLYEISNTYLQFLNAVENEEIPAEAVADTLESIEGEFNEKADNIACMIKNLDAEAQAIKAEKDALDKRLKSKKAQSDSLKNYLSNTMQLLNMDKIETSRNALSFRKSTSLCIEDESNFIQTHTDLCEKEITYKIPKTEITKMLKNGQEISGAELKTNMNLQVK